MSPPISAKCAECGATVPRAGVTEFAADAAVVDALAVAEMSERAAVEEHGWLPPRASAG